MRSYEDPAEGNGITATSSAVAGAGLDQSTNQTNTNTASITLPAQPVVPATTEFPGTGLEIAAQVEGVLQLNVNEQEGLAVASATSDYVSIEQGGPLSAGGDGITATSSAAAGANLTQTANQTNSDSKTIDRAAAPIAGEGERILNPQALDVQLEAVLQANVNSQSGASIAAARSGPVDVDSHDELSAGGDGIATTSSAVAGANLAQIANQSNSNSVAATGGFVLQGQLAGRINVNQQEGASIAAATSDYVDIEQTDLLKRGGDGITATSSAVAGRKPQPDRQPGQQQQRERHSGIARRYRHYRNRRSIYPVERRRGAGATRWSSSTSTTKMAWLSPPRARAPSTCGASMIRQPATASPPRLLR